jgi:hypothetical protein
MAKDKKRSHDEAGNAVSPGRSPKKLKEGHSSSPGNKNKAPQRDQRRGRDGKGSPAKGDVNGSGVVDKSSRKKVYGHTVSGQNGTSSILDTVDSVIENGDTSAAKDTKESKSSPKKQKKHHKIGSPSKSSNAGSAKSEDLAALFSEHDRLLPGAKRKAMAQSYSTSEPYLVSLTELTIDTNISLSPISSIPIY